MRHRITEAEKDIRKLLKKWDDEGLSIADVLIVLYASVFSTIELAPGTIEKKVDLMEGFHYKCINKLIEDAEKHET